VLWYFGGIRVAHRFSFLCCGILVRSVLLIVLVFCVVFLVGSVLLIVLVFCVVCVLLCNFALYLVFLLLPVSLDCPFLMAHSVFSNVYLHIYDNGRTNFHLQLNRGNNSSFALVYKFWQNSNKIGRNVGKLPF
jgi:hypothetical protein